MLKSIKNTIQRYKGVDCNIRFSDYFESDVLNVTVRTGTVYKQLDVKINHLLSNGAIMCKLVHLGVNYKVESKIFKDLKQLVIYLK